MTRTGKIARLPRELRDQLNRRLDNGEPASSLVRWLNSLPEVQAALATHFDGQPITENNLSNWKQAGFLDWQKLDLCSDRLRQLTDAAATLGSAIPISQTLATLLAAHFALAATDLLDAAPDPADRWDRLRQLLPHLARFRREDHRAQSLELARRRSQLLQAAAHARQVESTQRAPLLEALEDQLISDLFASPDPAHKALAVKIAENALAHRPEPSTSTTPIQVNPGESNQIQPNGNALFA